MFYDFLILLWACFRKVLWGFSKCNAFDDEPPDLERGKANPLSEEHFSLESPPFRLRGRRGRRKVNVFSIWMADQKNINVAWLSQGRLHNPAYFLFTSTRESFMPNWIFIHAIYILGIINSCDECQIPRRNAHQFPLFWKQAFPFGFRVEKNENKSIIFSTEICTRDDPRFKGVAGVGSQFFETAQRMKDEAIEFDVAQAKFFKHKYPTLYFFCARSSYPLRARVGVQISLPAATGFFF